MNNNNKPVTLEDLVVMVKNGFDDLGGEVGNRFDKVEQRLTDLEREMQKRPTIEQIDLKLTNMETRLKADLGEKPLERDRVLNKKTDTVAAKLGDKQVFTGSDVHDIRNITPIAVQPFVE